VANESDELLEFVDDVIIDEDENNKLKGMNALSDDTDEVKPLAKPQKKKMPMWKVMLYAVSITVVVMILGISALIYQDFKKQQQRTTYVPSVEQNNAAGEAALFGNDPVALNQEQVGNGNASQNGQWGQLNNQEMQSAQNPQAGQFEQQVAVQQQQQQVAATTPEYSQSQAWMGSEVNQEPQQAFSQSSLQVEQQGAPQVLEQAIATVSDQRVSELTARVDAISASQAELNKNLAALIEKLDAQKGDTPAAKAEKGSTKSDFVTQATYMKSLQMLRAIKAQYDVLEKKVTNMQDTLGESLLTPSQISSNNHEMRQASSQPNSSSAEVKGKRSAQSDSADKEPNSSVRELAWLSYVENFGIAYIEGALDSVELRPGDVLTGRGMVKSISSFGCIYFTNGKQYAPTNGVCK
jgi:hypothetical protein